MIADDTVVSMLYTLRDDAGEELDASEGDPLHYLHGHSNIIPGLEKALAGLSVGDKKHVVVQPEDGYGIYHPELEIILDRKQFGKTEPTVGTGVELHGANGEVLDALIVGVGDSEVQVNANHPLAGKVLHFDVEIAGIRPATEEELEHGHPHGADGHSGHGHEHHDHEGCGCDHEGDEGCCEGECDGSCDCE